MTSSICIARIAPPREAAQSDAPWPCGLAAHAPSDLALVLALPSHGAQRNIMTATTPPVLQGPTSKEKKYDRQLRLWAASGQAALEEAHILLINSGPGVVGIETLKNLVLPGKSHIFAVYSVQYS